MAEISSEEQNKVKRMKRAEDSLRGHWNYIKNTNIWIIGVPEEERKKKGHENIFEEIMVENFPNMEKEINSQSSWRGTKSPMQYKLKEKHADQRHILIKLTKAKHKERILKAAREKQQVTCKGNPYA